ncbi:MAG: PIG-L family deacetylase [Candidatus Omnitrophica bacterium]|nr:PIG-L family deacetylase [Candidatus Omnitrophota bacterium]
MRFDAKTRLLVVAAHPDDEVLGCGGTIVRAVRAGARVGVLFLGEGVSARFPVGKHDCSEFHEQSARRWKEANKALKSLGVRDSWQGSRLCVQFDTYPFLSITKEIEGVMKAFRPTMIFTHNPSEVNIDHRITFDAVEVACRPVQAWCPREIYTFEIPCSGNWKFHPTFNPNVFVDVAAVWERKMTAWRCYCGEQRRFPHFRSEKGLEALAAFRGMTAGLPKAEAFRLERGIA